VFADLIYRLVASGVHFFSKCRGALLLLSFLSFGAACSVKPITDPIIGPSHTLNNAYRKEAVLPGNFRRVAVLPVSYNELSATGVSSREILEPVFQAELTKLARFEALFVRPAQLQQWSGRERWDDYEELPPGFLKTIAAKTGCDGVLFARISHFQAYPPIVIGWRMRLVSNEGDALWAADELFDAAEQAVSNSARRYDRAHTRNNPVLEDSRSILLSPTKFGQYTLSSVFGSLPVR
jgi:hypothetical protein